jgi:hypothetical protein
MKSSQTDKDLQLHRVGMLALLDEMDARNPISAEEQKAGEHLWAEIESSLAQARSRSSRQKKGRSA